jgi:hypothetical protein
MYNYSMSILSFFNRPLKTTFKGYKYKKSTRKLTPKEVELVKERIIAISELESSTWFSLPILLISIMGAFFTFLFLGDLVVSSAVFAVIYITRGVLPAVFKNRTGKLNRDFSKGIVFEKEGPLVITIDKNKMNMPYSDYSIPNQPKTTSRMYIKRFFIDDIEVDKVVGEKNVSNLSQYDEGDPLRVSYLPKSKYVLDVRGS